MKTIITPLSISNTLRMGSLIKTKMMQFIFMVFLIGISSSCGEKGLKSKNTETAINQLSPILMVFPSDALLKRLGCIDEIENQGTISYKRNYGKAFVEDSDMKFAIASVEESFASNGYPLENLEQQLKQIDNDDAMDAMEGVAKDARTLLMNTARPDFIIEIDYEYKQDPNSRNPKKILTYILTALDVYTNKSVASISRSDIGNENENGSLASLIKSDFEQNISGFQNQIKQRFADELTNGVEITLRITTDENANLNLTDECLGSQNYNDWVNDWLKKNTVISSFKPIKNTDKELKYTNVRIKPKTENGERYSAFDFTNDLKSSFSKACGIKATNRTQGIGDAYIVISGLK
jgi:hypothetical protein